MPRIFISVIHTSHVAAILVMLFTPTTYAGTPRTAVKLGWDMASSSPNFRTRLYTGALIAGEVYGSPQEYLPGRPVFGAGIECIVPFDSSIFYDIYTFIPLYGAMRITLLKQHDLPTSLVFKLGYNWLTGKEDQHAYGYHSYNRIGYHGGVYYDIGFDRQLSTHAVAGIHVAEHQGTVKYLPRGLEQHVKYWRLSVVFGYLFG